MPFQFDESLQKLILPTLEGYEFVNIRDIYRCEAEGNYTNFYFRDSRKIMVSKTLKHYVGLLGKHHFIRISRSQLVNLRYAKKFVRQKHPILIMEDGSQFIVSLSRKEELLSAIKRLK